MAAAQLEVLFLNTPALGEKSSVTGVLQTSPARNHLAQPQALACLSGFAASYRTLEVTLIKGNP